MHDYYKALGVSRSASQEEIRKAYKKLARENHPDVKPDDKAAAEKFKQAAEAYDVLGDPEKRKQYDQFGSAYRQAGPTSGGGGGRPFNTGPIDLSDLFGGQVDLEDILGGEFGGGFGGGRRGRAAPQKGRDVRTSMVVPFHVAARGGQHEIQLQTDGTPERIDVKIPAGVRAGTVIRLAGLGEPGPAGGPPGDLLISVEVAPHPYFRREGNNVLLDLPLTMTEAALGTKVDVPTIDDVHVTLTVPPGASSGTKLRLRGKGFTDSKSKQPGDQIVVTKIVVPRELSDHAKTLLNDLAAAAPQSPREGLWR
ncbi:MAG: DnaJ domain-containing protein [Planctomycetaceae bacterium]|nr:DnaJ domain-containing protein [Planctomycetaceae bacterium]